MSRCDERDKVACPRCRGSLQRRDDGSAFLCHPCHLSYPVRDSIPIMLLDEATQLRENEDGRQP